MTPLRLASLIVRIVAICVVVVAPWLRPRERPSGERSVVFVVDRSASVGEALIAETDYLRSAWEVAGGTKLGVVAFDSRAELVAPVGTSAAPGVYGRRDSSASDLASAVRLAVAALPSSGHRSIVLLTDARPTRGDAVTEVRRAAEAGIRVDVVPVDSVDAPTPRIVSLKARSLHVAEKQPVALEVTVRYSGPFTLRWTRDGVALPPHNEYVRVDEEGERQTTLADAEPPPGVHVYEVKVAPRSHPHFAVTAPTAGDDGPSSALTAVSVEGRGYAAVFSSSGVVPPVLGAALSEGGLEARPLPMERIGDAASYAGADLVVLADVRVSGAAVDEGGLTKSAQASLVEYVERGGGLLVTGGTFGLAPEYAGTPIARAIPVEIEDRGHVEDPPVALAIMLDRSGSMAATVGAHTKLELAIEASLAAADVLRASDRVAIASVDTETHWDVPLGPQARLAELRQGVRNVAAGGGGIYVYTALKDAYGALAGVDSPVRHAILFSDTSDSEEQIENCPFDNGCEGRKTAETLAREARAKGITTTVVGIGEEEAKDTEFLRQVAAAAGGRFYLTTEGADLRRIFLAETRVLAQSNLHEQKTRVSGAGPHPVLEGIDPRKLPELGAYVETGLRSGADTALLVADPARPEGRPMLATWRYGLGKAGAIATDLAQGWGTAWASSTDAAKLLRQTIRFLLRQSSARRADANVVVRDRRVEVELELPPDAPESTLPKALDVLAVDKDGVSHKVAMTLEQRGPGRYVARGRSAGEPIVIARAYDARGAAIAEAVGRQDRASEFAGAGADKALAAELANLGGGRVNPTVEEALAPTARPAPELVATWPNAFVLAAILVVIDLVLRRLGAPRPRRTVAVRSDQATMTEQSAAA